MTVLLKPKLRILYLYSAENVNLSTWMAGEGVTDGNIQVIIPDGEIIGGTVNTGYALNMGNLSAFDNVELVVNGEIQGKGGAAGVAGSHALYTVYPVTITVSATGAIRAGGGGGGSGGKGGDGNNVGNWDYKVYNDGSDSGCDYIWTIMDSCYGGSIHYHRWCDHWFCSEGSYPYRIYNGYAYKAGALKWSAFYDIQRAYIYNGSGGNGGGGGQGQGYNQTKTNGSAGSSGSNRGGTGGTGGNGGDWGASGSGGATGGTGYSYTRDSSNTADSGNGGSSGKAGGRAIYTLEGPATGVIVNNAGIIQGSTYY